MMIEDIPTGDLEAELKRRQDKIAAIRKADRESRQVVVDCPNCHGSGQQYSNADPIAIGTGCAPEFVVCRMCHGGRRITAYG